MYNFEKSNTIRDKINDLIKNEKNPIDSLPDEHTVQDIFLDLQDEKYFNINVVNDVNNRHIMEFDQIAYHELVKEETDWSRGDINQYTSMDFFAPLIMKAVERRYTIRRFPKILTITPTDKISVKDCRINPDMVYDMFNPEIERLRDYLGDDFRRLIRDDVNLVTIVMFNSYEFQKIL